MSDRHEPPVSPLQDAVDRYQWRFGESPWVVRIPAEKMPAWIAAIHRAVETGQALTDADLDRVTSVRPPPPGALS